MAAGECGDDGWRVRGWQLESAEMRAGEYRMTAGYCGDSITYQNRA